MMITMISQETALKMARFIQDAFSFLHDKRIRSSYEDQEYARLHHLVTLIDGNRYAKVIWTAIEELEHDIVKQAKKLGLIEIPGSIHNKEDNEYYQTYQGEWQVVQEFAEFCEDKAKFTITEM
jgi:hypothetical protein